jgi:hypothetical protein
VSSCKFSSNILFIQNYNFHLNCQPVLFLLFLESNLFWIFFFITTFITTIFLNNNTFNLIIKNNIDKFNFILSEYYCFCLIFSFCDICDFQVFIYISLGNIEFIYIYELSIICLKSPGQYLSQLISFIVGLSSLIVAEILSRSFLFRRLSFIYNSFTRLKYYFSPISQSNTAYYRYLTIKFCSSFMNSAVMSFCSNSVYTSMSVIL